MTENHEDDSFPIEPKAIMDDGEYPDCTCPPIKGCGHFELTGCRQLDPLIKERYAGALEEKERITRIIDRRMRGMHGIPHGPILEELGSLWMEIEKSFNTEEPYEFPNE